MTQVQSTSLATIDFIIAALDTRMAACIMSGNQVTRAFRTGVSPARGPGLAGANGALPNPGQLLWIHGRYIAQGY